MYFLFSIGPFGPSLRFALTLLVSRPLPALPYRYAEPHSYQPRLSRSRDLA
jgi:hypothetical protein